MTSSNDVMPEQIADDGSSHALGHRVTELTKCLSRDCSLNAPAVQEALSGTPEATEVLAEILCTSVKTTRTQRKTGKAPVCNQLGVSETVASDAAVTMLQGLARHGHIPGRNLIRLLAGLLNVDRHRQANAEQVGYLEIRRDAILLDAQFEPVLSAIDLAEHVGVTRKTITEWRKAPEYQADVTALKDKFDTPRR